MDCYEVLRKWLGECRMAQGEDGLVRNIAPQNDAGGRISDMLQGSAGWGDACVLVPWALYEAYGDKTILEENYDMMRRWMAFCEKRAQKTRPHNLLNPWHKYLVDEGFHFGEWCQPDVDNTDAMKKTMMLGAPEVATAYYFRSASLMAQIAEILGKDTDAEKYASLAANAKKAYRHACTKNGKIKSLPRKWSIPIGLQQYAICCIPTWPSRHAIICVSMPRRCSAASPSPPMEMWRLPNVASTTTAPCFS